MTEYATGRRLQRPIGTPVYVIEGGTDPAKQRLIPFVGDETTYRESRVWRHHRDGSWILEAYVGDLKVQARLSDDDLPHVLRAQKP